MSNHKLDKKIIFKYNNSSVKIERILLWEYLILDY